MNNKLKPALIGGVVLGILSVIPFVSAVNLCCCLWAILGGMLATYLYVKNSPTPVDAGDGAVLGALAGVVGALSLLCSGYRLPIAMGPTMRNLIVSLMENADPRQAEMMRRQLEASGDAIAPLIIQWSDWGWSCFSFLQSSAAFSAFRFSRSAKAAHRLHLQLTSAEVT